MTGRSPAMAEFAAALRSAKAAAGLNLRDWARRSFISRAALHRYCQGQAVPQDYLIVQRLAETASVSQDETVSLHRLWVAAGRQPTGPAAGPALGATQRRPAARGSATGTERLRRSPC
ncbi:transcriptional regulator with XRE-family HTH domain [Allocatelliglobosispora scoriae]|uniref:Transcriptional regulator with XRE-family HTH domain n=1 Tax=Allocatelliglobosispora scoriae TaxID=643052 RepID=A0A841BL70_9ACTN|nr:helix-turn-helix domain-containing protein [Allocatelliglobosispora scoriae]MBB5867492.1 transcriptional regulator with XRE-family HTH domain [Allocatelliglobosispora scoriae]